jgi:signal transduction histidine kinase
MSDEPSRSDEDTMRGFRHVAIGELGAGIVHEVRNLVTSIRGFAQIAARRADDGGDVRELLDSIELKSGHCVATLNRFLELARSGTGKLELLDINDAARGAEALLRHHMQIHRVVFEVELGEGLPAVMGDRLLLQQALVNLLLNAQQAMPEGGVVRMTSRVADESVEVSVTDNGPGIAEEVRDSIFETGVTTKEDGCGFGLALCRDVLRRHDGDVDVEPSATGGTRFSIRIPAAGERDG